MEEERKEIVLLMPGNKPEIELAAEELWLGYETDRYGRKKWGGFPSFNILVEGRKVYGCIMLQSGVLLMFPEQYVKTGYYAKGIFKMLFQKPFVTKKQKRLICERVINMISNRETIAPLYESL